MTLSYIVDPDHAGDAWGYLNQSGATGAATAKSLDLVVGGEASQRAAWSRSSRTADKEACFGGDSIMVEKESTTALLSGTK